eukprot:snap_masked-scaffold_14-processed-gene-0.10-mRNA-1 protein AED:1.00 eAED:1.00 QI:0/-1/0/0/-1/1/1/0/349
MSKILWTQHKLPGFCIKSFEESKRISIHCTENIIRRELAVSFLRSEESKLFQEVVLNVERAVFSESDLIFLGKLFEEREIDLLEIHLTKARNEYTGKLFDTTFGKLKRIRKLFINSDLGLKGESCCFLNLSWHKIFVEEIYVNLSYKEKEMNFSKAMLQNGRSIEKIKCASNLLPQHLKFSMISHITPNLKTLHLSLNEKKLVGTMSNLLRLKNCHFLSGLNEFSVQTNNRQLKKGISVLSAVLDKCVNLTRANIVLEYNYVRNNIQSSLLSWLLWKKNLFEHSSSNGFLLLKLFCYHLHDRVRKLTNFGFISFSNTHGVYYSTKYPETVVLQSLHLNLHRQWVNGIDF